ncbi:MAG: hypothetical protein RLY78_161 [Pseudomonadota bacterium]|jgi:restriction system protein
MAGRHSRALDKLMSTTGRLPVWSGFVLAAGLYASLHAASRQPALLGGHGSAGAGETSLITLLLTVAQYLLPALCLLLTLRAIWRRHRLMRREQLAQAAARAVAELDGRGFARLIAESFQRSGYRVLGVHGAGASGGRDHGADIELSKDGELHLVQVRYWRADMVDHRAVRQLNAAITTNGASRGWIITSGLFTEKARQEAALRPIRLIDGCGLLRIIEAMRGQGLVRPSRYTA